MEQSSTVRRPPSIVVLTGSGISAESGLTTFRAQDGLWEDHSVEDVATPQGFARDPGLVYQFYNTLRRKLKTVVPNAAHQALAHLEAEWPGRFLLITQNVDDLHERCGSRGLLHMHGELQKSRCVRCNSVVTFHEDLKLTSVCHACQGTDCLRPHIVWFGETPLGGNRIGEALQDCDFFVAIGTSGHVYPASQFVRSVPERARKIEINIEPSAVNSDFSETRLGKATEIVPPFIAELLALDVVRQYC